MFAFLPDWIFAPFAWGTLVYWLVTFDRTPTFGEIVLRLVPALIFFAIIGACWFAYAAGYLT